MIIINRDKNDLLKFIAVLAMLIDHIGFLFYPSNLTFRIVGRIAFPIFAYHIAVGYKNTSNLANYYKRLLIFSIISQGPYSLFDPNKLNIFFTLILGLLAIHTYDKDKKIIAFFVVIMGQVLNVSYGAYGVLTILLFFAYFDERTKLINAFTLVTTMYSLAFNNPIQIFSIIALFFINRQWKFKLNLNKYVFYIFYPLHIVILLIIKKVL